MKPSRVYSLVVQPSRSLCGVLCHSGTPSVIQRFASSTKIRHASRWLLEWSIVETRGLPQYRTRVRFLSKTTVITHSVPRNRFFSGTCVWCCIRRWDSLGSFLCVFRRLACPSHIAALYQKKRTCMCESDYDFTSLWVCLQNWNYRWL